MVDSTPALCDPRYSAQLWTYGCITLLIRDSYAAIKNQSLFNSQTGELRGSLDTIRRLAETQKNLANSLCLSPEAARTLEKPIQATLDIGHYRKQDIADDASEPHDAVDED